MTKQERIAQRREQIAQQVKIIRPTCRVCGYEDRGPGFQAVLNDLCYDCVQITPEEERPA